MTKSASPDHRSVARRVGDSRAAEEVYEGGECSKPHGDQFEEARSLALGPTVQHPIQSRRILARQLKGPRSQYPWEADTTLQPKVIQFAAFIDATDSNDQQMKMGAALSTWTQWNLSPELRPVTSRDQKKKTKARNDVLLDSDLSSHRAKATTTAPLTTRPMQDTARRDLHQQAPTWKLHGARMLDITEALPLVEHLKQAFGQCENSARRNNEQPSMLPPIVLCIQRITRQFAAAPRWPVSGLREARLRHRYEADAGPVALPSRRVAALMDLSTPLPLDAMFARP
ncbi:hypothetical protein HPB50_000968 [Hyalomma asiaticum]|uniref:Uncharacterized protein n=1 Tax=Hyalomma asiaticum TaxID=266040 RepID=A0ACB7TAD5_HYAAI|nr:hypothetical protein HPB50_000968 [Hyalomma asiaticum]